MSYHLEPSRGSPCRVRSMLPPSLWIDEQIDFVYPQQVRGFHVSHEKKNLLLSMKSWLVYRDPGILIMAYEIIPI